MLIRYLINFFVLYACIAVWALLFPNYWGPTLVEALPYVLILSGVLTPAVPDRLIPRIGLEDII